MLLVYLLISLKMLTGFISPIAAKKFQMKKVVFLRELINCPDKHLPNTFENSTLVKIGMGQVVFNSDWNFTEPAEKISGYVTISKCTSRLRSDCEHFLKAQVQDACKILVEKGQIYTPVYASIKPKMKCPIHKGVYRQRNGTWNNDRLLAYEKTVPFMRDFLWRFRVMMLKYPEQKEYFCYDGLVQISKVRVPLDN